jgi:hypothetical protein
MMEAEEQQKELELGRGNRARKEVAYQEQLSERDWLKVSGNLPPESVLILRGGGHHPRARVYFGQEDLYTSLRIL